jgi:UPF0176 protein
MITANNLADPGANWRIAAFYQFTALADPAALRPPIFEFCANLELKGTLLLAPEGINGTLAGSPNAIGKFSTALRNGKLGIPQNGRSELKFSSAAKMPFKRLKIRLRPEIVTLKQPLSNPAKVGTYIDPARWHQVLDDPETLLIDTRNAFEIAIGSFPGAINPQTARFSDFTGFAQQKLDPKKHKKIAMFCTGGIRCEKASAWLLQSGFEEVLHLQGGILNYLDTIPAAQSRWQGECFVFDDRETLSHADFSAGTP